MRLGFRPNKRVYDHSLVHVAITLDVEYLRGSITAVHSILRHALCPENVFFHFLVSDTNLQALVDAKVNWFGKVAKPKHMNLPPQFSTETSNVAESEESSSIITWHRRLTHPLKLNTVPF
ncbi:hypothetical protein LR48_Vigan08g085500 [Vigna angularis]|uniref:Uncharacterized protein n=1 Tax=Phaseolus angularis TaxID=3914 RepID=A0A0L9V507_PHAAN|nr:hypothetical protein LR48_Vigan08g085500 [Vigna angularis]